MKSKIVREPIGTWWKIISWNVEITPLKVVAVTEKFVTYLEKLGRFSDDEMRERRESRDDIFPTFEEAKAEALKRIDRRIETYKNEIKRLSTALGQWQSLKKSEIVVEQK